MDYKQQLKSLRQYQKQYNKILAKIEQYKDKLDWLNEQATELESIIYNYNRELRLY